MCASVGLWQTIRPLEDGPDIFGQRRERILLGSNCQPYLYIFCIYIKGGILSTLKAKYVWSTGSSEAFLEYTGSPSSLLFCRMICKLTSGSHTSSKSNCKEIKIASNKKWNTAAAVTPKVVWVLRHHITKTTSCSPGHSSFDVEGGIWAGDGCQVVSG